MRGLKKSTEGQYFIFRGKIGGEVPFTQWFLFSMKKGNGSSTRTVVVKSSKTAYEICLKSLGNMNERYVVHVTVFNSMLSPFSSSSAL